MEKPIIFAGLFWLVTAGVMLLDEVLPQQVVSSPGYYFTAVAAVVVIILAWFLADASDRGILVSTSLKIAVVALRIFAVPYYRFRYAGLRNGMLFLVKCVGMIVVTSLVVELLLWVVGSGGAV